jgi:hypothetical protein
MKKILFLFVLIIASVQTYADTRAQALLLHNGQGKSFDADQLQQAVNEAVAGDTICLSEGTFMVGNADSDTLIIEKGVSVIGAGEMTILAGNINIAIDGEPSFSNFFILFCSLLNSFCNKINISLFIFLLELFKFSQSLLVIKINFIRKFLYFLLNYFC